MGIQALILEANETVGGRMQSIQVDDALIDYGAQFLSSAYTIIPDLIKEAQLNDEFVKTSDWVGLIRNQGITLFQPQNPWQLLTKHVLSIGSLLRLVFNQVRFFNLNKKSLNDITEWTKYDGEMAIDWMIKNYGKEVANKLAAPIVNGFYFQSLNHSSAALIAAVLAFSVHRPKTMALISGMDSLPQKLANQLNIKTNVSVSSVMETPSGIKIISDSGEWNTEHVIMTVPAPIAKNLIQKPDKQTLRLLETEYSSSIIISLLTSNNWTSPSNIQSAYGFLYSPEINSKIAAIAIENNKYYARSKQGFLINIMLSDQWAKKLLHLSDEDIYKEIQIDVENILPNIYSNLQMKKMFRWQYAMPYTPIGRAKAVKEYCDTRNKNNRMWLAGDYLGFPWTDSAAQTGLWAANQVLQLPSGHLLFVLSG